MRVLLQGDFESISTAADNSKILPTDTMKNTVYSIARGSTSSATIEEFALELGDYLLANNPQVSKASVEIEEKCWERLVVDGIAEATTFKLGGPELQTVHAERKREDAWKITSGVDGLTILKTTKSAFTGYIKDKLTTLKPRDGLHFLVHAPRLNGNTQRHRRITRTHGSASLKLCSRNLRTTTA